MLQQEGERESQMLREAILYYKGVAGLSEIASNNYQKHPTLYLDAMQEYETNHEYQKLADIGYEAIKNVKVEEEIRGEIALKTSLAEHKLGNIKSMKSLWREVYLSDKREVNLLRLFLDDEIAMGFIENDTTLLEDDTTLFTKFLMGEFEQVKKACVNPENSLGWSGRFIKQGIELFLLYLYAGAKLPKSMETLAREMALRFGFSNNEEFYYLESDYEEQESGDRTAFWLAFSRWKGYFEISENEKHKYLIWIGKLIEKRIKAIVRSDFLLYLIYVLAHQLQIAIKTHTRQREKKIHATVLVVLYLLR